jgi:hypothetical protein
VSWSEHLIARKLARITFARKCLVIVPNCQWTGHECDLLVLTADLRVIDVEVKISRADLRADQHKDKWWHRIDGLREHRNWPAWVWKHYYAMPAGIWKPELLADINQTSGVLLMQGDPADCHPHVERPAKPNRHAKRVSPAGAVDIARLANLRMWEALARLEAVPA